MSATIPPGGPRDAPGGVRNVWCSAVVVGGTATSSVRFVVADDGRINSVHAGVSPEPGDLVLGTVLPGMGNAHSHAFHRALRGRTHAQGGDFWRWRESMYAAVGALDPDVYFSLARAVFAEMLVNGWTAVGEFHYVHHRSDGTPYPAPHAMELALAAAAREVGIRLVLLDTSYLAGGMGRELEDGQKAFGDGTAERWLTRWRSLRDALAGSTAPRNDLVTLGAAVHSVRAVPADAIRSILSGLPDAIPLHIHVSEQPQENADSVSYYGCTPTALLESIGALAPRLSLVHATHLTPADIALIGVAGASVVMCPTTEADLGDGIGPARALADAGASLALGSDQNAVIDPMLEMRALEAGERLASGRRGRFEPAELLQAASAGGYRSLGLGSHGLAVGDPCDLIEVSTSSIRTVGSATEQLVMSATGSDIERVVVGGRLVAEHGRLVLAETSMASRRPANLMQNALGGLDRVRAEKSR